MHYTDSRLHRLSGLCSRGCRALRLLTFRPVALVAIFIAVASSGSAATLTFTAPVNGSSVPVNSVTLRATASGFAPASVEFYEANGTPDDNQVDSYLGQASRAPDGSYSVTSNFGDGSGHLVYVQSAYNGTTVRGTSTFAVDRRTGPTSLGFVSPPAGSVVTANTVTLRAMPVNFKPDGVDFYKANGTPDDNQVDEYLGRARPSVVDGAFEVTADFTDGGPYLAYAQYFDGFNTVRGTVTFSVDTRAGATAIAITAPEDGAALTAKAITVRATATNFTPNGMDFYEVNGTPDDNMVDRYLGRPGRGIDGSYSVTADYASGSHGVYAQESDGYKMVRSPIVHFSSNADPTLTLSFAAQSVTSCAQVIGTVTLSPTPTANTAVALSANSAAVTFPTTVTILAGQASVSFPVDARPVRASTPVTFTATMTGASATAVLTLAPYPHYAYVVEDLGTLGGTYSVATAINAAGQVSGYADTAGGTDHAFRAEPTGTAVDIAPVNPNKMVANDINNGGQVAGYLEAANGIRTPFRTDLSGAVAPLATAPSVEAYAQSINDAGKIAGYFLAPDQNMHAFRADASGSVTDLGLLSGGTYSYTYAINNLGQIVGFADDANGDDYGFRVAGTGSVRTATILGAYVYPYGVGTNGSTTGELWDNGSQSYHMFRATPNGSPTDLGTLGTYWTYGYAINTTGVIAGTAYTYDTATKTSTEQRAVIYSDATGLKDLNTLIDPALRAGTNPEWELIAAYDVNDLGQVVGYGLHNGNYRAFRLTPSVPAVLYGDADGDAAIGPPDVVALLRMAAGIAPVIDLTVSDVAPAPACNPRGFGDGKVTLADAVRVARYLHDLEPVWP